jgi:hypothetical protein
VLIVTHFRTSVTTLETDTQVLCATTLIARPGTWPTLTIPMAGGRPPDAGYVWRYLRDPAEFFGIAMPSPAELAAALAEFAEAQPDFVATTVTIVEADGSPQILVAGTAVRPLRSDPVRLIGDESVPHAHRATDPWWRRMAARTTSRGELDQRERWLNGRGYVDALTSGEPMLGALVFETSGGVVGVENPEPTSVLDQLARCDLIDEIDLVPAPPTDAWLVWWVSPRFETHPVAELAGTRFPVSDEVVPSFARWS